MEAEGALKTLRTVIVVAVRAPGCGPDKGGGSSGTGGSTGSSASSTGGPGTSTTDATPTTGVMSCDDYVVEPDEIGPAVAITLRNAGSEPVWLAAVGCAGLPQLAIADGQGEDHYWVGSDCSPTQCQDFLGLDDCSETCNNCGPASARRLDGGAAVEIVWPGSRVETALMTAACAPGANCQRECLIARRAEPGVYDIQVTAFRACTGECACDGPFEQCALWGQVELGEAVDVAVPLMVPEVTAIDVLIGGP
jgi:hypothetical protein